MRIRRLMAAATLTLLAALAGASPASAEPGNGADVVNESYCVVIEIDNGTYCFDSKYVSNITETPSGNFSSVGNGESSYEFVHFSGLCSSSQSSDFNSHFLVKDGTVHEQSSRGGGESSFECDGTSQNCTYTFHGHFANGRLQFNRPPEFECT